MPFHFVKAQLYCNLSGFEFISSERKVYIYDCLREEKVGAALHFCLCMYSERSRDTMLAFRC